MPRPRHRAPRAAPGAIERLYVYWVASTALLLLTLVSLAMLSRAAIRQQAARVDDLAGQVAELRAAVESLQKPVTTRPTAQSSSENPAEAAAPGNADDRVSAALRGNRPDALTTGRLAPRLPDEPVFPAEYEIRSRLDDLLTGRPASPLDVRDRLAATALLNIATEHIARADWGDATWGRLAVLSRLMGRDAGADTFARRAGDGQSLATIIEVSIRGLLAHGQAQEAEPAARQLMTLTTGAPTARVLLSAVLLVNGQPAAADEVLRGLAMDDLTSPAALHAYDRLLLARALLALEDYPRLATAVGGIGHVPEELRAERDFLSAVVLARGDQAVLALAILDGLAADVNAGARHDDISWPLPQPTRYEIAVWRGVTLLHTQQLEAARETLRDAVGLDSARGDAQYYLGLLEARAGRGEAALNHLRNAVACAPRMAAAWEALATLGIDADRVDSALANLKTALQINDRRASAHFLAAVANAKAARRSPAAAALRAAFALDSRFISEAGRSEVLTGLFTADELGDLAAAQ